MKNIDFLRQFIIILLSKKKNVYFLHNFNSQYDLEKIDPSSELLTGSLFTMIGVGVYMGFKNFYFVGMNTAQNLNKAIFMNLV